MKKIFILFIFLQFTFIYSYDDDDHMYLTIEAYNLLKNQGHYFPELGYRIGDLNDFGDYKWQVGKITTGAFREDQEDVVFHYTKPWWMIGPEFPDIWNTNSHFWNADLGEDYKTELIHSGLGSGHSDFWENAWKKMRYYRDGNWTDEDNNTSWIVLNAETGFYRYMYYNGLVNLYVTGNIWCESFTNHAGQTQMIREYRTLNWDDRNKLVWEILGRMCHLLQDQTVPAHAHGDIHAYSPWLAGGEPDALENWVSTYRSEINRNNAGNFIDPFYNVNDPVKFLFYTGNQLADHFPSDWRNNGAPPPQWIGDNSLPLGTNYLLMQYYSQMGDPPNTVIPSAIMQINLKYAIRATAGLLYWFAISTGLQHCINPPLLLSFSFDKPMQRVYARETGTLTANISNANAYLWQYYKCGSTANGCGNYSPLPTGLQIISNGNKQIIKVFDNYVNESCNTNPPSNCNQEGYLRFTFRVTALNNPCWSTDFLYQTAIMPVAGIRPPPSGSGGCPYLYVWNNDSTYHLTDNNLLHRSEFNEFANIDITDKYKLQIHPNLNDGKYSIQIGEYENDHDYIDMVKLFAVDHPLGTKIAITEHNDIVMYDTTIVQGPDDANRNGANITANIQYYYQGKLIVSGNSGDNIYAHYDSSAQSNAAGKFKKKYKSILNSIIPDSMALIGNLDREPIGPKGIGGVAYIFIDPNNHIDRQFAMRENISEVVIPFSNLNDAVDHIEINWQNDYSVSYFAVVPIAYSGFTVTELNMYDALHSIDNADILSALLSKDNSYTELDSADYITIRFDSLSIPQNDWVRDFVIETNGRYSVGTGYANLRHIKSNIQNHSVYNYALYTNYPNPFNPKTSIRYDIGGNSFVKISVYNLLGQLINVLVNESKVAGNYSVDFDGSNLPSGLYIYKIEAGDYIESKKMLLIK
ncbi:MAG: T9SS type A sorting domain-containing protein [Ignavibacteria bacterium]|nr:T9SS type A sorting domain-containing protein [Ignavibacteria bacterium]